MTNRPLTPKELKLAPEWATHYYFYNSCYTHIVFESEERYQSVEVSTGKFSKIGTHSSRITKSASKLPKEPFNLDGVEWSDNDVTVEKEDEHLSVKVKFYDEYNDVEDHVYAELDKQDVINLNKALGITAEDLK